MSTIDLKPVIIEMWTEYAIGVIILFTRIWTRCVKVVGWHWQGDDYLAVAAVFFFTVRLPLPCSHFCIQFDVALFWTSKKAQRLTFNISCV